MASEMPYTLADYFQWAQEAEVIGRRTSHGDVWARRYGFDVTHLVTHAMEIETELASMTERSLFRGDALSEIAKAISREDTATTRWVAAILRQHEIEV